MKNQSRKGGLDRRSFLLSSAASAVAVAASGLTTRAFAADSAGDLIFWSQLAGSKKPAGEALEAAFREAHPEVNLNSSLYSDPEQLNQKLLTSISGGTPPDLFIQHWDYTLNYGSGGKLLDMSDTIASIGDGAINEGLLAYTHSDGPSVSVPLYGTSRAIGFNREMVTEAGLDPDSPPQNWDEIREWSNKMTKRSGSLLINAGFNLFYNDLGTFEMFALFLQSAGGSVLSDDLKSVAFAGPEGVRALQFLRDLVLVDKVTDPGFGIASGSVTDPFGQKRAAMMIAGNYSINNTLNAGVDFGVTPVPMADGGGFTSLVDPFCFAVPTSSKNQEQAKTFIEFALSEEQQVAFAVTSKNVPALKAAQSNPQVMADPYLSKFVKYAEYAPAKVPSLAVYARIYPVVARAVQETLYGRQEAEPALSKAAEDVQSILQGA